MKKGPALHQLIHSMSTVEKRHFKRFARRHSDSPDNNYLRLFEAILQMPRYDEPSLLAAFQGEPFLNNFSVAKTYLYDLLLRALRLIQQQQSVDMELRQALDHVELLHKRGLREQASALIRKALRRARKFEALPYHAELLRWQRRLLNVQGGKELQESLAELEWEERELFGKMDQEAQLRSLRAQIQAIFSRQVDIRQAELQAQLDGLMGAPVLQTDPERLAFHGRVAWHFTHAHGFRLKNRLDESLEMYRSLLATWHKAPQQQAKQPDQYLNALSSFLDACLIARRYDGFEDGLLRIRSIRLKDAATTARAFFLSTHFEISYAFSTGELAPTLRRAKQILQELERNMKYLSKSIELTFLFNLAVLHFLAEDYAHIMSFLNRILNQGTVAVRKDIQEAAKVLELITQYTLGNESLVDSKIRSLRRHLKRHPRQHPFERLVVDHLHRLNNLAEPSERREELEALRRSLEEMLAEKELVGCEEVLLWAKGQLEGKRMVDYLRKKG